jgi:flagellar hook assembly protein FlgD
LALTGASAVSSAAGAQLTFTLSAPANVSVTAVNLAGRQVKTVCVDRECTAGLNTLLWDGRTDLGLAAPAGTYLVQIEARATDGAAARALAPLRLGR